MRRYDLQVHTDVSPCSRATPAAVVEAAQDTDLDGIAITNHDTLDGYSEVNELAPASLTVLPGVEVTTSQGHLLALDVHEEPPQSDPLTAIENIHSQGGVAILSHPFDRLREYYTRDLDEIAAIVDGVEVINSRCILSQFNRRARAFTEKHELAMTGGSDAHFPIEIGRAYTVCDQPILDAIRTNETSVGGRGGYLSGHVATKLTDLANFVNK